MQVNLVAETVGLAQRLHEHVRIRVVYSRVIVDTFLLGVVVVVLDETENFVAQVGRALVARPRWSR